VLVGGGYGTGREVVEFVSSNGTLGGLGAIGVFALVVGGVVALSFEFARVFQTYDYRRFFQALIGPAWIGFELVLVAFLMLVLAVVLAAASDLLETWVGVSPVIGIMLVVVTAMGVIYSGRDLVEKALSAWAALVCVFLLAVVSLMLFRDGELVMTRLTDGSVSPGWWRSGMQFAFYNMAAIPVLLYTTSAIQTRAQAISSGLITGLLAALPGILMHLSFIAGFPDVLAEALPLYSMLERLGIPVLIGLYAVVLIGTIVQTAIGALEGVGERISSALADAGAAVLSRLHRAIIAGLLLGLSTVLSSVGIIDLVAKGYGAMAWVFLAIYIAPLCTVGVFRIRQHADRHS